MGGYLSPSFDEDPWFAPMDTGATKETMSHEQAHQQAMFECLGGLKHITAEIGTVEEANFYDDEFSVVRHQLRDLGLHDLSLLGGLELYDSDDDDLDDFEDAAAMSAKSIGGQGQLKIMEIAQWPGAGNTPNVNYLQEEKRRFFGTRQDADGVAPYVDVKVGGKKHTALVDTGATRGIISTSLAHQYGLNIEPTRRYIEGFNNSDYPTLVTEMATATIEYEGKVFSGTFLAIPNPLHSLILPCSMLAKAGIVMFAKGVKFLKSKLSGLSTAVPFVASRITRRSRSVREWFYGREERTPDPEAVRMRQRQKVRNEEERRREAEDNAIRRIPDEALRAQRCAQEMRIREAWDTKFKAGA